MWIVRFALQRPYTFVIVALLIAIFGISAILKTPTDILPDIAIPIVSVIWTYSGMGADDMSKRIVGVCERALPTTVNNIQYTESQSYSGVGVIKIHFPPNVQIDLAIAQVTALAQSLLRLMPTGILPPYVLKYDASSVPIVQVNGAVVQMKDVAWIRNGYQPQTSYVSENGQASALLTVIKNGASSTLTIVDEVKAAIPKIKAGLPSALTLTPIFDQSVIVRASIRDVAQEAITAAILTAFMILIFLGNWRSTL